MKQTPYQRKMAENEAVFRRYNENIQAGIKELKATAQEDNQTDILMDLDTELHFYCECADEKCTERIIMKPNKYDALHKSDKHFIIIPGHEVPSIEKLVKKTSKYEVVEKFITPPSSASMNPTALQN